MINNIIEPDPSGYVLGKDKWFWIIVVVFGTFCFLFISPSRMLWDGAHNFMEAYEIGYNCVQDDFSEPGNYTEGGFDYWESNSFWIEQGYEEGYKKGARDYVKQNSD